MNGKDAHAEIALLEWTDRPVLWLGAYVRHSSVLVELRNVTARSDGIRRHVWFGVGTHNAAPNVRANRSGRQGVWTVRVVGIDARHSNDFECCLVNNRCSGKRSIRVDVGSDCFFHSDRIRCALCSHNLHIDSSGSPVAHRDVRFRDLSRWTRNLSVAWTTDMRSCRICVGADFISAFDASFNRHANGVRVSGE